MKFLVLGSFRALKKALESKDPPSWGLSGPAGWIPEIPDCEMLVFRIQVSRDFYRVLGVWASERLLAFLGSTYDRFLLLFWVPIKVPVRIP